MMNVPKFSRRALLAGIAVSRLHLRAETAKHVPIGLLIYAVLADWKRAFNETLTAVSGMGYEGLELTQYESWTPQRAREVRALLDSLNLKVFATHTEPEYFVAGDKMKGMIEINQILGTQTVCCVRGVADSPSGVGYRAKATGSAGWKELADVLQSTSEILRTNQMACSFHNHPVEFRGKSGERPIDILAQAPGLTFHIDVNVCRQAGSDPVAFMKQYPGRIDSLLLTDGPADASRHAPLFGKGDTPWKDVFATAEQVGGVKFYLLTHGSAQWPPLETVKRDLEQYKLIHG